MKSENLLLSGEDLSLLDSDELNNFVNYLDDNGFEVVLQYNVNGTDDPPVAVEFFLARTR